MKCIYLCFIFLLFQLVSSLEVSYSCPSEVYFGEEFSCFVDIIDSSGGYDVKFYIKGESGMINQIFDGVSFRRSDWYVNDYIMEDGRSEVLLKIHKDFQGIAIGEFKLRDSKEKVVFVEIFEMEIKKREDSVQQNKIVDSQEEEDYSREDDDENQEAAVEEKVSISKQTSSKTEEIVKANNVQETSKKVINLTKQEDVKKSEVVYRSKSEKVKDLMVYAFMIFLIGIIGFLLIERKW